MTYEQVMGLGGMKIAYFSTEYPPRVYGGLGVYVDSISRELAALGDKISVFAPGEEGLKRRQTRKGVTVFRDRPLPMRDAMEVFLSQDTLGWGDGLDVLMDLLSYNQLGASRLMESGPFDLCVAHDWLGLPGAMAVKRAGVPVIYHVHGLEVGRSESPNPQLVALERRGAKLADAVLTVSQAMRGELVGLGVPEEKVRVCYHGVDTDAFSPRSCRSDQVSGLKEGYGIGEEDPVILFVGRLEPVKGVVQLLEAMPSVLEKHPRARLLVVGKGTLEKRAMQMAASLDGSVTLVTDFLDQRAKVLHYAMADLCVFPSLYEPFGIVGVEAAAMERAAVVGAAGVSGLREIVENPGEERPTGVHVDPRNPADIAWGINLALEDPGRLRRWGKNARERCLEMFTWPKAAEVTRKVYEEVLESRS